MNGIGDYTLAYIPYDSSGNPLVDSFTSEYIHYITFKSANILPGDTFGYKNSFYSSAGYDVYFYIDATVSSITYMDDTIWNAKGIDSWAKDAINNFSVDKARQTVESYKDYSNKAVDNGYLQYAYTMVDDDIAFELLNSSRKTITGIELLVLLYDSNGYSVDTFSDFMVDNCFSYKETASLAPGDTHFLTTSYLPRYNAKYCNSIIFSLDFSDGTHWTNPYTGYWIKYNENMR